MANNVTNILLAGVGGQGILLASEVLSEVLMLAGYDVKKNEIHGMSQRGGSVVSHVRFGEKVYSPIIPEGEGDILFGFELLETYRYLPLLRKSGKVLVNDLKILPPSVALGQESYPEDIPAKIAELFPRPGSSTAWLWPLRPAIPVPSIRYCSERCRQMIEIDGEPLAGRP